MEKVTDKTFMWFGIHKNKRMAQVPADYLLFLLEKGKCGERLKDYITENKEVLEEEAKKARIEFRQHKNVKGRM